VIPTNRFVTVPIWLMCVVTGSPIVSSERALAAPPARAEVLSVGVAKPLLATQVAIQKSDWGNALDDIRRAQTAANKTDKDEYNIDSLLSYVLYRQNKYEQAAAVYERLLDSPLMPAAQRGELTKGIAEMYFRLGNYPEAARWARTCLEWHTDQPRVAEMLGDAYFRMNDYKNAVARMTALVAKAEETKRIPKESWLRIIEDSYYRLGDIQGMESALVPLVRYFHEPEDWRALLDLYSQGVQDDRVALGYHRLRFSLNMLKRADDYEAMVFEALDARVPAEARQVLERGFNEDVFSGPDSVPGRYKRLLKLVEKELAANRALLPRLIQKAKESTTGQDDVLLGQAYLSYGRYDEAVDALNRGITKGGVQDADEARISLGIAYLKLDLKDLADEAFRAVSKGSQWADLAELWRLHLDDNAPVH
jgi:tetratricopeptide (TPR) repeat protein